MDTGLRDTEERVKVRIRLQSCLQFIFSGPNLGSKVWFVCEDSQSYKTSNIKKSSKATGFVYPEDFSTLVPVAFDLLPLHVCVFVFSLLKLTLLGYKRIRICLCCLVFVPEHMI